MTAAALEIDSLTYAYSKDVKTLDAVSFDVPVGSFTALLGPNGAGKTTLMSLATRLFAPRGGKVVVCGHDLAKEPGQALAAMGVVFQKPTVDVDLSVDQNLRYAVALQGMPPALGRRRIDWALERLQITDRRRSVVRALSGGLRRRVELARALLHEPRLLILDEPTVGLDIESRQSIVEHCHALCADAGLAVLWTTHLIDEVWDGDRVVVLHRGQVKAKGSIAEICALAGSGSDLGQAYRHFTGGGPARPATLRAGPRQPAMAGGEA